MIKAEHVAVSQDPCLVDCRALHLQGLVVLLDAARPAVACFDKPRLAPEEPLAHGFVVVSLDVLVDSAEAHHKGPRPGDSASWLATWFAEKHIGGPLGEFAAARIDVEDTDSGHWACSAVVV